VVDEKIFIEKIIFLSHLEGSEGSQRSKNGACFIKFGPLDPKL
jgi:hypothetical protein